LFLAVIAVLGLWDCKARSAPDHRPLILERTIPLPGVKGRIDHLAIDATHGRLFVAELGNGSVEAVDVASGRSLGRINGLSEPQGLGYLPDRDELAVATGGDGTLRVYRAADLTLVGSIKLGEDADNVRIDSRGRVVVGYGSGALAIVDPAARRVVATIPLPAHPESFQLDGDRAYVNLPDAGAVAVVDLAARRITATWPNPSAKWNFPMALDKASDTLAVAYRLPPRIVTFAAGSGKVGQRLETCGDADDLFFDAPGSRLYVICGSGSVEVFERLRTGFGRVGRLPTRPGARTGLLAPKLERLFVAARAQAGSGDAAIMVYRPAP
jgi:DNA-binding beta-propeller fold protein YncE